jgi:DNA-binding NarL/FixJ family response regulator
MALRVHLADDHIMFREGIESILASREDVEVVGTRSIGQEALALIRDNRPDVVITQLEVDLRDANEILSGIREACPDSRIGVLTVFDNLHYLKALSGPGIDAFLHKSSSSEQPLATIDTLSRRRGGQDAVVSMPRALLERLGEDPAGGLSEWETEVLVLAARGLSNDRITAHLRIASAAVKRHLANVYQKVGVRSRSEAVRTALQEQWIGLREITHAAPSSDKTGPDGASGG